MKHPREASQTEAKEMIDEVEKQSVLKAIIKEALIDQGRGGKRGYLAFLELISEQDLKKSRGCKVLGKLKLKISTLRPSFNIEF